MKDKCEPALPQTEGKKEPDTFNTLERADSFKDLEVLTRQSSLSQVELNIKVDQKAPQTNPWWKFRGKKQRICCFIAIALIISTCIVVPIVLARVALSRGIKQREVISSPSTSFLPIENEKSSFKENNPVLLHGDKNITEDTSLNLTSQLLTNQTMKNESLLGSQQDSSNTTRNSTVTPPGNTTKNDSVPVIVAPVSTQETPKNPTTTPTTSSPTPPKENAFKKIINSVKKFFGF